MSVRVYSPAAGLKIRLKIEDAADGSKSVETEATTTAVSYTHLDVYKRQL